MGEIGLEDYSALLEQLLQQENDMQFEAFTNHTAYQLGTRIVESALAMGKTIVVDIDRNGEQLFYCKMNDKSLSNDQWIARKRNVVHHFGHSSYYMNVLFKSRNTSIEASYLDPKDYAAEGGAFPLIIKNVGIVGTICVSGLPGADDHGTIVSAIQELLQAASR
jgi:uncharacterized protein (UPF0303 family)